LRGAGVFRREIAEFSLPLLSAGLICLRHRARAFGSEELLLEPVFHRPQRSGDLGRVPGHAPQVFFPKWRPAPLTRGAGHGQHAAPVAGDGSPEPDAGSLVEHRRFVPGAVGAVPADPFGPRHGSLLTAGPRAERMITFLHAQARNNSQNGGNFAPPTFAEFAMRRELRHSPKGGARQSPGEETEASSCGDSAPSEPGTRCDA